MKDFYELLEISRDADAGEIKRAYFQQVRKFPPQKFPEEFKQIREAYETLSDDSRRAEYESSVSLPPEALSLINHAEIQSRSGNFDGAVDTLKGAAARFPDIPLFLSRLAELYEDEDKPGLEAKVLEELCKKEPANTQYRIRLARAYGERAWRKKAIKEYTRVINEEPSNGIAWVGLIDCYGSGGEYDKSFALINMALENVTDLTGKLRLYVYSVTLNMSKGEIKTAEASFEKLYALCQENVIPQTYYNKESVTLLFTALIPYMNAEWIDRMRRIMGFFPEIKEELFDMMENADTRFELDNLQKEGYAVLFAELFDTLIYYTEDEDYANDLLAMEANMLFDFEEYRRQINRLQQEHPKLYEMHAGFFRELQLCRDPEPMLIKRLIKLEKQGLSPKFINLDGTEKRPEIQTFRRDKPKIGRNEKCPCGSGKKYKHCCGA